VRIGTKSVEEGVVTKLPKVPKEAAEEGTGTRTARIAIVAATAKAFRMR
jgi:hypothetical protein